MMSEANVASLTEEEWEAQLPVPVGYRVLVALPDIEERYEGSEILKTEGEKNKEFILSILGIVLDMGEDAYKDPDRYPNGPWCKRGDYVMFRANSGTRFKIADTEYRLMNDDSIEAVVRDPYGISQA